MHLCQRFKLIIDVVADSIVEHKLKIGTLKFVKDRTNDIEEYEFEKDATTAEVILLKYNSD